MKRYNPDKTLFKFLVVGVCNTLISGVVMFVLYNIANWSYWATSATVYIISSLFSFFLNKYFTFQMQKWSWKQAAKFVVNVTVCYLLAYGIAKPAVQYILYGRNTNIQENVAMLAGICIYTTLNYLGQRFYTFTENY